MYFIIGKKVTRTSPKTSQKTSIFLIKSSAIKLSTTIITPAKPTNPSKVSLFICVSQQDEVSLKENKQLPKTEKNLIQNKNLPEKGFQA